MHTDMSARIAVPTAVWPRTGPMEAAERLGTEAGASAESRGAGAGRPAALGGPGLPGVQHRLRCSCCRPGRGGLRAPWGEPGVLPQPATLRAAPQE